MKTTTLNASKMANTTQSHLVCILSFLTLASQLHLPKCKYRCAMTKANIPVPRTQCRYIQLSNDKPNAPLPSHTSICMLETSVNTPTAIRQKLHALKTLNFLVPILFIPLSYFFVITGCKGKGTGSKWTITFVKKCSIIACFLSLTRRLV